MDAFEEANFETTINQTLRDMKGELRQLVTASADAMANSTRLKRQHEKLLGESKDWKNKAKKALQSGREDLAKKALSKSKEFGDQAATLAPQAELADKTTAKIKSNIQRLKDRISEAERSSKTLIARKNAAKAQKKVAAALADLGDGENAFSTLQRLESSVEKDEAQALAFDELAGGGEGEDLEAEIAMLGMDDSADDDLAALKAELEME
jgi:phage shock protein A